MSTWYRTGTVSVTNGSKNVVGTGTAWSVMISVGDVFTLDNSILYEIQTITDDLHIVLDRNYEGSTATDQTYTIIPWSVKRSLNSEILDRINKLLEWAHEIFVTQWTTDTNGDYEVSTTLDKNVVPKVNNGASLGTTLKKWAKAYLTALSINGVDILPTATPTAASIPVADANGDIDSGWLKNASATVKGVVELATSAEAAAGNDTTRAITPSVSGSRITFATTSTDDATSETAAPLKTAGGLAVAKQVFIGTNDMTSQLGGINMGLLRIKSEAFTLEAGASKEINCEGGIVAIFSPSISQLGGLFFLEYGAASATKLAGSIGEVTDTGSTFTILGSVYSLTWQLKNKRGELTSFRVFSVNL